MKEVGLRAHFAESDTHQRLLGRTGAPRSSTAHGTRAANAVCGPAGSDETPRRRGTKAANDAASAAETTCGGLTAVPPLPPTSSIANDSAGVAAADAVDHITWSRRWWRERVLGLCGREH